MEIREKRQLLLLKLILLFKQELSEKEYSELTEEEKRFYQRDLTRKGNYSLNITARNSGVKNFDKFHNSGYGFAEKFGNIRKLIK